MTHLDSITVRAKIFGVSPIPRRVKLRGVVRGTVRWVEDFVFRCLLLGVIIFALTFRLPFAEANPDGGRVVAGQATITQTSPSRIDVLQQSNKAIIDWRSFNIKYDEHTNFQQPSAAAIALNRVNGGQVSTISGFFTGLVRYFNLNLIPSLGYF